MSIYLLTFFYSHGIWKLPVFADNWYVEWNFFHVSAVFLSTTEDSHLENLYMVDTTVILKKKNSWEKNL